MGCSHYHKLLKQNVLQVFVDYSTKTAGTFNEETGKIEDDPSLDFSTTFMNELSRPFRRLGGD